MEKINYKRLRESFKKTKEKTKWRRKQGKPCILSVYNRQKKKVACVARKIKMRGYVRCKKKLINSPSFQFRHATFFFFFPSM